jgi:hypothetical protein
VAASLGAATVTAVALRIAKAPKGT